MNDRTTHVALLVAAVPLELLLLRSNGIVGSLASNPHSPDEVRELTPDDRVMLSAALFPVLLGLDYRWHRLGRGRPDGDATG